MKEKKKNHTRTETYDQGYDRIGAKCISGQISFFYGFFIKAFLKII